MKENGKRREWVKTAAIVFLSVMLVLTFFSNTIMNYSLPEVATQYVMSGSITAKIRGTGMIESGDPYNVKIKESRKVASVVVRVGDEVQKDDILMYLEDSDSEELKAALAALETQKESLKAAQDAAADAKDAYDRALLNADISTSDIQAANGGISVSSYRGKVTEYQKTIEALENELAPLEQKVAELNQRLADVSAQESYEKALDGAASDKVSATLTAYCNAVRVSSGKAADAEAEFGRIQAGGNADAVTIAQSNYDNAVTKLQGLDSSINLDDIKSADTIVNESDDEPTQNLKAAKKAFLDAKSALADARKYKELYKELYEAANNARNAYYAAVSDLNTREASTIYATLNSLRSSYTIELYGVNKDVDNKKAAIKQKQSELDELLSKVDRIMGIEKYLDAIDKAQEQVAKAQDKVDKAQEEVDKQTSNSIGATITSPIAGKITGLNIQAGDTTYNDMTVAVMQPEGRGYTMSFSVTNEQAKSISVGDHADLINAWRYDNVTVTLKSIKADTTDPGQKKLLTFDVTGNVMPGQSLSVSVGQKSSNYDYIVPNSAVREDNNGKFILIVTSKPGPLSTRYIASRVDVEVLASDDTQSAIRGALNNYDFVITTSTKPVEAGKQVRLSSK